MATSPESDLEVREMDQDVADYREARAADDGSRITIDELRRSLAR